MIRSVRIRGLGVIDETVLEPSSALTAVTGETGAGKTMVVTGIGLLLGDKADTGLVRHGCDRAVVEASTRLMPVASASLAEQSRMARLSALDTSRVVALERCLEELKLPLVSWPTSSGIR